MVGLLVLANPIISLLLTDKWSGVVYSFKDIMFGLDV